MTTRHRHHRHKVATAAPALARVTIAPTSTDIISATATASPSPPISLVTLSTVTLNARDLPTITYSSSSSSASPSPTYDVQVPIKNPNIHATNMPSNFVFIVVGAILAAIFSAFLIYRVVAFTYFNLKAKSEKEVYYSNQFMFSDSASSNFGSTLSMKYNGTSSDSSFFEKSDTSDYSSSTPGHTYRETAQPNRGSMYISPVLEVMHRKSLSQMELPLYHQGMGSTVSLLDRGSTVSLLDRGSTVSLLDKGSPDVTLENFNKKTKRPPSLYLEDLLNDTEE